MKEKVQSFKRALISKKFVNGKVLALTVGLGILFLALLTMWIRHLPSYLIILIDLPLSLITWHRMYQILYDLKLLFVFNDEYDVKLPPQERVWPTITFIIPSYQEPFSVAKMTFDSVVNAPYSGRKEIIAVDNSRDTSTEAFLSWKTYVEDFNTLHPNNGISAKFLHNQEKRTLKPGNLDLGQKNIEEGKFVVILDVDSALPDKEDLLELAVAELEADSTLAFIQFRIKATNGHFNDLSQAVAVSQDLLRLRMISRGYGGYKIFEGHNGIWRKTVLDELGTWTNYYRGKIVVTEDILKSTQAYAKGYYGKPLNIQTGEWVPSSLKALEGMWMRWMYGNSQTFFKYFRNFYSRTTSLSEKVDLSFHIGHHLVTLFFFLLVLLFQLFIPGPLTNIFILAFGISAQLIGAATSYFTDVRKMKMPMMRKFRHLYAGFFMIETFIMYTQIKSDIKFLLRIPQGWKVTEKGLENSMSWNSVILNNLFYIVLAALSTGVCVISWCRNYHMSPSSICYHLGLLFINFNLLLCIAVFGKQGRKSHNDVGSAIINNTTIEKLSVTELMEAEVIYGN
ncbi:glycosyltransferase family 2 protein [Flavitalea sp. BT771]|uniref:glycosyltransferase n=1 Tax=Flavitalea sp. BT771 TaxID=3063329 RepID=UPI0026E44035|nr:glycosyltransferase family 2 protein [Flavitalea sp. BT771]MDO6434797.1 glycosyltransferase family 2 protein [Flavitalea sp. BT771]MDV6223697.1 glycosyltransferase family 2 protein [Flavitalea sp. BT771]